MKISARQDGAFALFAVVMFIFLKMSFEQIKMFGGADKLGPFTHHSHENHRVVRRRVALGRQNSAHKCQRVVHDAVDLRPVRTVVLELQKWKTIPEARIATCTSPEQRRNFRGCARFPMGAWLIGCFSANNNSTAIRTSYWYLSGGRFSFSPPLRIDRDEAASLKFIVCLYAFSPSRSPTYSGCMNSWMHRCDCALESLKSPFSSTATDSKRRRRRRRRKALLHRSNNIRLKGDFLGANQRFLLSSNPH